jgi:hypothetical protein
MHAVPKDQKISHGERWQREGIDHGLPDLDPGEYLVGIMLDLRPTRSNGMDIGPTDWPVIAPFGEVMGLDSEDMLTLSKMCRGYHEALREGENPLSIAPVDRE